MNNRLKELRGAVFQKEFAASLGVSYIDGPLLSRIESGQINPTPEVAKIIADKLGVRITDIWPAAALAYPILTASHKNTPEPFANSPDVYSIVTCHIPLGKGNAVSREYLSAKTRMSDRRVRKYIEYAREDGEAILNAQDGKGYYYSDDPVEIAQFVYQEQSRAYAILKRLTPMRQKLDKLHSVAEGQLMIKNCLRCGEPCDGDFCEACKEEFDIRNL